MLRVVETCRQQHRDAFARLTRAVEGHFVDQAAPSLLSGV
jgi:hypothetical protein